MDMGRRDARRMESWVTELRRKPFSGWLLARAKMGPGTSDVERDSGLRPGGIATRRTRCAAESERNGGLASGDRPDRRSGHVSVRRLRFRPTGVRRGADRRRATASL